MKMLLVLPLLAAGCAMGWTRPNTTDADFRRDSYECEQDAARLYPAAPSRPAAVQGPASMDCRTYGNQTSCNTTSSTTAAPSTDLNATNRNSARFACLKARGYTFQTRN